MGVGLEILNYGGLLLYSTLCLLFLSRLFFNGQEFAGDGRCLPMTMIYPQNLGGHAYITNWVFAGRSRGRASFVFNFEHWGLSETKAALIFLGRQFDYPKKIGEAFEAVPDMRSVKQLGLDSDIIVKWDAVFATASKRKCADKQHVFAGLSWIILDGYALGHYHHILEHIHALWALSQEYCPSCRVERVVFMCDGEPANWAFVKELYTKVLRGAGGEPLEFLTMADMYARLHHPVGSEVLFERAVTSDRFRVMNKVATTLAKMNAGHADLIKRHMPSLRASLFAALGLPPPTTAKAPWTGPLSPPIQLLVIDRNESESERQQRTGRDFLPALKRELLRRLRAVAVVPVTATNTTNTTNTTTIDSSSSSSSSSGSRASSFSIVQDGTDASASVGRGARPLFNVSVIVLQALSFPDQVRAVARADALLGLHGNGLTHVTWLAASRNGQEFLCEVFPNPTGRVLFDYQVQSDLSSVRHFGFSVSTGVVRGLENIPRNTLAMAEARSKHKLHCALPKGSSQTFRVESMDIDALVKSVVTAATTPPSQSFPPWPSC